MEQNKRQFFRFDVTIPCIYQVITQEEAAEEPLPEIPDAKFIAKHFLPDFTRLDGEISNNISLIEEKSPLLAETLRLLNRKLDTIHERVQFSNFSSTLPIKGINLSGNGMKLSIKDKITTANKVDVMFQTYPDVDPILTRCSVVNIYQEDGKQKVSLSFDSICEKQQREIVYFLQNKEIELLQKSRI
ncbi:PilZ domain-containing protein [Thiomicrospira sp. ALE5]|uniref:PilZ domain-containing protein n=1 Tax=Thiomicrospira sp. ALE5 TaxID=748650 RepID=UPI0008E8D411|nr:PilZ domain-containing protein [Thiomicrospira sp. ALE5]SFR60167.1 PilZ domain-containing protein [Thiomicrospira sp. ALE5]